MDNANVSRTVRVKRIAVHTRVSGKFGDFVESDLPGRRRKRARIFGTVVVAIDEKRYRVLWDNGQELECYSNSLRVENEATLPPDLLPERPPALPPALDVGNNDDDAHQDEDASVDLPNENPDEDDLHSNPSPERHRNQQVDVEDLPIGALPTATQVDTPATYSQQRASAKERIRQMVGQTTREKSGNISIVWTVIQDHNPPDYIPTRQLDSSIGWKEIDTLKSQPKNMALAYLFLELLFKDKNSIRSHVDKMNEFIKSIT